MININIPDNKIEAVEKAMNETFGSTEAEHVELLDGGYSSSLNFKILIKNKPFVLRIIKNISPVNDPTRRFTCMKIAAQAGIAPKVYYTDTDDAIAIVDYIDAKSIQQSFNSFDKLLPLLADLVRNIHDLSPFPTLVNFLDGVDLFIKQFKELNMFPEEVTADVFKYYKQIQKHYPRDDQDLVASHNDLHARNILCDGNRLWVIDWEAAFLNDRYADLAIVAKSFVSDKNQEKIYLNYYFGDNYNDYKKARYYLMQQVCHMYYAMLMFKFAATMRSSDFKHSSNMDVIPLSQVPKLMKKGELSLNEYEGRLIYGKALLNEALNNMKRIKYDESIAKVLEGDYV